MAIAYNVEMMCLFCDLHCKGCQGMKENCIMLGKEYGMKHGEMASMSTAKTVDNLAMPVGFWKDHVVLDADSMPSIDNFPKYLGEVVN
jgi:hypothetical protein